MLMPMLVASHDTKTNASSILMSVLMPVASHDQKSHVTCYFNYLDLRNAVVPLMILFISCDTEANTNGITWPNCHVAALFYCIDVMNSVVPLTMSLAYVLQTLMPEAWYDQKSFCTYFSDLDQTNAVVQLMILLASHDTGASGITWPNESCCISFGHLDLTKWNDAIEDTSGIMWH